MNMKRNPASELYTKICAEFSTPVTADSFCRRFDADEVIAKAKETGCEMFWVSMVDSRGGKWEKRVCLR